jgi:hypothetical protein
MSVTPAWHSRCIMFDSRSRTLLSCSFSVPADEFWDASWNWLRPRDVWVSHSGIIEGSAPERYWLLFTNIYGVTSRKIWIFWPRSPSFKSYLSIHNHLIMSYSTVYVQPVPLKKVLKLSRNVKLTQRFRKGHNLACFYTAHLKYAVGGWHWCGIGWNMFKGGSGRGILLRHIKAHS